MSVQTPPSEPRSAPSQFDQYVEQQLESTRQQVKLTELSSGLLTLGLWTLGFLLVGILIDSWLIQFGTAARIGAFLLLAAGALWIAWSQVLVLFLRRIHRLYAARMIEESSDNFHNSLVNYLQVKEGGPVGKDAVVHAISQRAARDLSRISATEKVDRSRAIKLGFGFVGLVAALVAYTLLSPKSPWPSIARILNPVSSVSAPSIAEVTKVSPGDTDVFFGQKLLVTAEIRGRHDPDEVKLVYSTGDGQHVEVPVAMLRSGTSNAYQLELSTTPTGIDGPLTYYVTANDGRSATYSVSVKPNPAITVDKIEVISPSYTRLPPRTLTGQVEIEGIEGSQVKLTATANMPIQVAWVELLRQKTRGRETTYDVVRTIELRNLASPPEGSTSPAGEQRHAATGEFTLSLDANRTGQLYSHYQVLFRTVEGQRNQLVNVQPLRVTPDLPPEVKIVRPFDREVSVPLNRSLEIELQAEDPDFEISRLELLLDHQGGRLLDEQIELSENRKQQRLTGNYRFDPRKLKLSVGDVVIFHARASDNRVAALSGQSEPNVARTENYSLKIAEPLETEIAEKQPDNESKQAESGNQADQSAQARNQAEKSESAENQDSQQAANQTEKSSESKSGENSAGQAESAMNDAKPGKSNEEQSKPSQAAQQQQPETGEPSSEKSQPQENPEKSLTGQEKPEQKQPEQQEKSESTDEEEQQKSESSGDSQSGEQSKQSSGGAGGQKAQQSSGNQSSKSDQPQDGNQGEQSGEAEARPDASEKQMGKQGSDSKSGEQSSSKSDSSNQSSAKNQENQSPNQENAEQQSSGRNSEDQNAGSGKQSSGKQSGSQPAGGEKTDGGQQGAGNQPQAGQPQEGEQSNSSGSGQRQGDPESNKPAQGGNPSGSEPKEKQSGESNSGQSGASDSMGEESSNPSEPLDRSASDAERFQRLQERMKQQQSQKESQSESSSGESGQEKQNQADGEKSSGSNPSGEKNSQQGEKGNPSSGDQTSEQKPDGTKSSDSSQPSKKDGEQSDPDGNRDNSGKQPEGKQQAGEPSSQANPSQGAGEKGSGQRNSEQKPSEQDAKQGSGEESSGEQSSEKSGSGESGNKQASSGDEGQKQMAKENSKGQGDQPSSESGESGKSVQSSDQSGKQSGGDSKQGGNDSQSGSGKSGQGSDSKQGGEQSGKSGSGGQSGAGESSGASGSSGNAAGSDSAKGSNQEISQRKDQPKAQRSPGGKTNPSSAGVGSNEAPSANYEETPGDPEGNLEYSEKATDLVLEHLRNQANNPDPELLKEMNWTEQDLKDFIARWEAMKQKAGSGTAQERKRYEDAIRSLGLRPESVRRNVIQSRRDQLNKLSEDGAVNRPPANLANEFNSFLKNRNRVQKDK